MSGIYIHIPFCKQACYYCDFHFSTSLKRKSELVEALSQELVLRKNELSSTIETIYFGGGTPSLLTSDELQNLMNTIYDNYQVSNDPEITLEANPDDLLSVRPLPKIDDTRTVFENYKKPGINRLSIGIQSFFDDDLNLMNRAHNAEEAKKCLSEATQLFDNISIDLIYGIPGITNERWLQNLEIALSYNIPHISSYALTVEPRTALKKFIETGKIQPVSDVKSKEQYLILVEKMNAVGYINYEFSNFGKEGYFSKNNTAYWQGKPYLGIGPSAHSFNGKQRSWNIKNNLKYINSINKRELPQQSETLNDSDKYNEYIMMGLRTMWGVSIENIDKDFGKKYSDYLLLQIKKPIKDGLLEMIIESLYKSEETKQSESKNESSNVFPKERILKITKKGKFLGDGIASNLFWID